MDNLNNLPDYRKLKSNVLNWLNTMRISRDGFEYKFSPSSGCSLYTTCFAFFILDLFRETDNLSNKEKKEWANYIKSFQRKEDGLFYPDPIYHPDKERAVFQATCFCLSALSILDSIPKYRLAVVDKWRTMTSIKEYLTLRGCHIGKPGSGNKAMFQAIFLTHEFEKTKDLELLESINAWFDFHNRYQNMYGFWGKKRQGQLYSGLQNAFHQFVIYQYWNRDYPRIENVVRTALKLQDQEGFFSDLPGGDSCKDYDTLHFLLSFNNHSYSREIIKSSDNAIGAIKLNWNDDGGFCENSIMPFRVNNYGRLIYFAISGKNTKISLARGKKVLKEIIIPNKYNLRKWVKEPQPWGESTLWDTWFRCLSIAETSCYIDNNNFDKYRFHKHIGLGFNKNQK